MSGNGGNPHSLRDLLGTYEKSGLVHGMLDSGGVYDRAKVDNKTPKSVAVLPNFAKPKKFDEFSQAYAAQNRVYPCRREDRQDVHLFSSIHLT